MSDGRAGRFYHVSEVNVHLGKPVDGGEGRGAAREVSPAEIIHEWFSTSQTFETLPLGLKC